MATRAEPVTSLRPVRGDFHVVIDPRERRRRAVPWALITVAGCCLFVLLVLSRIALDRHAFVLQDLDRQVAAQEARYWDLRMEVSELRDPRRVSDLAARMGMVYPDEVRTVEVPGLGTPTQAIEERWVSLKLLLSAQP